MTLFFKSQTLLILAVVFIVCACGVKKPPAPAYAMPHELDPMASPSPTPGFSNPSGPLDPKDSP